MIQKILLLSCLLVFAACNDSDFSSSKKDKSGKNSLTQGDNSTGETASGTNSGNSLPHPMHSDLKAVEQSFTVETDSVTKNLPLRMLWIIDNSGSMADDVEAVQRGIKHFIDSIATTSYSDINITFISCLDEQIQTCLNSSELSHKSISTVETRIESWDGLTNTALLLAKKHVYAPLSTSELAAALQEKAITPLIGLKSPTPEDLNVINYLKQILALKSSVANSPELISSLKDYFKTGRQVNVIISVTDDYATMRAKDFIRFLKYNYGSIQSFHYYGFVSNTMSPKKWAQTNTYLELAKRLRGKTFDIRSEANYSAFFKELSTTIKKTVAVNSFELSSNCVNVEHVLVDGNVIDESLYSCAENQLNIRKSILKNTNSVSVKYSAK